MTCFRKSERGFAIVSAVFLLVVLAALGAFMVSLSGVGHATPSQALIATRVYYGARSGLEWGTHQAVSPAAGSGSCNASTGFALSGTGLEGVSVTVTCSATTHTGPTDYYVYYLTSTATFGSLGSPDYAERKMEATVCRSDSPGAAEC